jgi:hypothetical protein
VVYYSLKISLLNSISITTLYNRSGNGRPYVV